MRLRITRSGVAHGFADSLLEHFVIPAARVVGNGRGERGCPALTHDAPRFRMINATPREMLTLDEAKSA